MWLRTIDEGAWASIAGSHVLHPVKGKPDDMPVIKADVATFHVAGRETAEEDEGGIVVFAFRA